MSAWAPGALAPAPAAASRGQMLRAQAGAELTLLLRNGEQLLLTMVIPLGLLVGLSTVPAVTVDGRRVDFFVPGILALAIMSTAFTGQAIATGFDRQYGVLKRLGATPLPRSVLLQAKTLAVLAVELVQVVLLCSVGLALGWHPHGNVLGTVLLIALGTAAFAGLGLLIGGTLPGLTTLAVANLVWLVLLSLGGVVFPLKDYGAAQHALVYLPTAALADGLRSLLRDGSFVVRDAVVLAGWAVAGLAAASRWFRWE
jgi:ABC-2 type transport system permease protein